MYSASRIKQLPLFPLCTTRTRLFIYCYSTFTTVFSVHASNAVELLPVLRGDLRRLPGALARQCVPRRLRVAGGRHPEVGRLAVVRLILERVVAR